METEVEVEVGVGVEVYFSFSFLIQQKKVVYWFGRIVLKLNPHKIDVNGKRMSMSYM